MAIMLHFPHSALRNIDDLIYLNIKQCLTVFVKNVYYSIIISITRIGESPSPSLGVLQSILCNFWQMRKECQPMEDYMGAALGA